MLRLLVQGICQIAQLLKLTHDPEGVSALLYAQYAFKANNTTGPHPRSHRINVATVNSVTLSEGCTEGKLGPIAQKPFPRR